MYTAHGENIDGNSATDTKACTTTEGRQQIYTRACTTAEGHGRCLGS